MTGHDPSGSGAGRGAWLTALDEAVGICLDAGREGITVRLAGGLAVQFLTPQFPPRGGDGQDIDLAVLSRDRRALGGFLAGRGYAGDEVFNALYGHSRLRFWSASSGRKVDVFAGGLRMCHMVSFAGRLERLPVTLDVADLLLTKLQIVELAEKDARDVLCLCSAFPVREGDEPGTIGLGRVCSVVARDWGWWRTLTWNLDRIIALAGGAGAGLVPRGGEHDAAGQLGWLARAVGAVPKGLGWRAQAMAGERVRWYKVPVEIPRG